MLAIIETGLTREAVYALVKTCAMQTWQDVLYFAYLVPNHPEINALLKPETLKNVFNLEHHLKHVDTIFHKVFGD